MSVPSLDPTSETSLHKAISALAAFKSGMQPPLSSWPARLADAVVALDRIEGSPSEDIPDGMELSSPFSVLATRASKIIDAARSLESVTEPRLLGMSRNDLDACRQHSHTASLIFNRFADVEAKMTALGLDVGALANAYAALEPLEGERQASESLDRIEDECVRAFAAHAAACTLLAELGLEISPIDSATTAKALADCLIDTLDLPSIPDRVCDASEAAARIATSVGKVLSAAAAIDTAHGTAWRDQKPQRLRTAALILRGSDPSRLGSVKQFCAEVCPSEDPASLDRMAAVGDAWSRMVFSEEGRALFGSSWDRHEQVVAIADAGAAWNKASKRHDPEVVKKLRALPIASRSRCQSIAADVIATSHEIDRAGPLMAVPELLDKRLMDARYAAGALNQTPLELARVSASAFAARNEAVKLMDATGLSSKLAAGDLTAQCEIVLAAINHIGGELVSDPRKLEIAVAFSTKIAEASSLLAPLPDAFLPGPLATARDFRIALSTRLAAHHAARDPAKLRGLVIELGGGPLLERLESDIPPEDWNQVAGRILTIAA